STLLAQIGLLAGAALWFIIQAVARPEYKLLCAGTQGRLKCAYHALTMAGAALMIAMMTHPSHSTGPGQAAMPMPMPASHHGMTTTPHTPTTTGTGTGTTTTAPALGLTPEILLTLLFATAALVFLVLLLRHRTTTAPHHPGSRQHSTRTEHALEALGATTMALMFATTA
ncbi:DUF5134 domain-containing protein, partial [Arthrobacter sp. NPDC058097]|uniref:DUF5134 domain-containing protein n=1 Tax=Arthrobacter sp. NPDC058097 TaxID=3346340 RepID=UPI0036DA621A